ncbi:hypothetical protein [Frankia sp. Cas3]|uniref:hypothetical protein n=1 Tax=Frankia sp. Cas3 TaxID=3073926 RepID=UPI002AD1E7BF|nr:hypothetical protein [Frankia sp. Cas3]
MIAILYSVESQWVRNVLATGQLTLVTKGREHALQRPELIPQAQALPAYSRWQRRILKTRGIEHFLWAHEHDGPGRPDINS